MRELTVDAPDHTPEERIAAILHLLAAGDEAAALALADLAGDGEE